MTACKACDGQGYVGTGIDEAPTTECRRCEGSGAELCQHGVEAETCERCEDERKQELEDKWAKYYRDVL